MGDDVAARARYPRAMTKTTWWLAGNVRSGLGILVLLLAACGAPQVQRPVDPEHPFAGGPVVEFVAEVPQGWVFHSKGGGPLQRSQVLPVVLPRLEKLLTATIARETSVSPELITRVVASEPCRATLRTGLFAAAVEHFAPIPGVSANLPCWVIDRARLVPFVARGVQRGLVLVLDRAAIDQGSAELLDAWASRQLAAERTTAP